MTGPLLASLLAFGAPAEPCPAGPAAVPCVLGLLATPLRLAPPAAGPSLPLPPAAFALRDDTIDAPPAMAEPSFQWTNEMTLGVIATAAAFVLIPTCWVIGANTFR